MFVFKRFDHVVVAVSDIKGAVADWEHVLGGTLLMPTMEHRLKGTTERVQFTVGDAWVELAQPLSPESPLGRFVDQHGQGVYAISVQVENVAALAARAESMGAVILKGETQGESIAIDPKSANGVLLELCPEVERVQGRSAFKRFHHVVVAVKDDDAAVANWEKLFGTEPHPEGPDRIVQPHHIPVGEAWFGLTSAGTDSNAVGAFLDSRGEGIYLVSVGVDNVQYAARGIRQRGGRIIGNEDGPGQVFVHPATTHGLLLELSDDSVRMWPD